MFAFNLHKYIISLKKRFLCGAPAVINSTVNC